MRACGTRPGCRLGRPYLSVRCVVRTCRWNRYSSPVEQMEDQGNTQRRCVCELVSSDTPAGSRGRPSTRAPPPSSDPCAPAATPPIGPGSDDRRADAVHGRHISLAQFSTTPTKFSEREREVVGKRTRCRRRDRRWLLGVLLQGVWKNSRALILKLKFSLRKYLFNEIAFEMFGFKDYLALKALF